MYEDILFQRGYRDISQLEDDRFTAKLDNGAVFIKVENVYSNETQALLELSNIEGVSCLVDTFDLGDNRVIVTKIVKGVELEEYLHSVRKRTLQANRAIAFQLINLVKEIHRCGWIHGDIHTSNIIVDDDLNVTLIDFGASMRVNASNCDLVPLYPPPESLLISSNQKVTIDSAYCMDEKYDYWALGLVLFRIFTHDYIPAASNFMLEEPLFRYEDNYVPYSYRPELTLEINTWLSDLLAHDPHKRKLPSTY